MSFTVQPIGVVRSTRKTVEDDNWDAEQGAIELDPACFSAESLVGLDLFSHVAVIYLLDRVSPSKIEVAARHPRNDPRYPKVGIFAQRGKNRPNRLGLTVCRVLGVKGLRIELAGLDALDETPVLDLKPWYDEYGPRGKVEEPAWVAEVMRGYWSGKTGD
ncbi:MAG: SAM-dependent methyltransferase [Deltaproteobacteria bacterium]|nr:SAM-dependent methyltransferase [Deltaproteobacteria bacterium]